MKKILLFIVLFSLAVGAKSNTIIVTTSSDNVTGSLRQCISIAQNNDTIRFDNSVDSVFIGSQHILISKNITIIGKHNLKTIVSSDFSCRLFSVDAGKIFNVIELKLKKGYSLQPISSTYIGGGAIWNRGTTNISSCLLIDNVAYGEFAPKGAALYNTGIVNIENTEFRNNKSRKSVYSTGGEGGAICNEGGTVNARYCIFDSNFANSSGGAIANKAGKLNLLYCNFLKNTNFDYFQSSGYGGAIFSSGASNCKINSCNFIDNRIYTQATSPSSGGIYSYGGAIYNDANSYMTISKSGFSANKCDGYNAYSSTVSQGGVIFNKGRCYINNSSFNGNTVNGQAGFSSSLQVYGKCIYNTDFLSIESSSFFDIYSTRETIYNSDTVIIRNNLMGSNNVGPTFLIDIVNINKVISLGYNLISRLNTTSYMAIGDQFGTLASPLSCGVDAMDYHGAETLNLALTATSQCVNTGDPAISYTDQRNYLRDGVADKGAYEYNGTKNCAFNLNSITVNHNNCFNGANGSIQLNVSGSNYNLFWDNAATSSTINGLRSGTYKFFLYDSLGCSVDSIIQINQPALLTSTLSPSSICNGDSMLIFSKYRKSTGLYTDTLTAVNGCDSILYQSLTVNPVPTLTLSTTSASICAGSTATLTASGATNYAWSTNDTSNMIVVMPALGTTFSVTSINSFGCSSSDSVYITVNALPTVSISVVQNTLCLGDSTNLNVFGALTYTWNTSQTTNSISVSPLDTTIYSVTGIDFNGCINTAQTSIAVLPVPHLTITAESYTLCEGTSTLLKASGANIYSWSTTENTDSIVVAPLVNSFYNVVGTTNGCSSSDSVYISVNNLPIVSVVAAQGSLCFGDSTTLVASGAFTYLWSTTDTTSDIVVAPTDTTVFFVIGTDLVGCKNSAQTTVIVLPSPVINLTSSPSTLCEGSSALLTISGANTYSWSTGNIGPNSIVSPSITTVYSATGIDANGCSSTQTVSVSVNNTCQDVWPGDANSDGTADNLDVLELGLHYTQTGTPRASVSNTWQSYFVNNWTGTITNGKNVNHSDCNGDGTINDNDTLAIYNNYGLTHAFKETQTNSVNPQISIVPDQAFVVKGTWGTASIYLGDATTSINNVNGVAFTVDFDNTLIETNSIYIEYQNSFMDAGQNLHFRKLDFANSKLFTATTHTINNNVSGNGLVGILHYKVLSSLLTDEVLNLNLVQGYKSEVSGQITPLTVGTGTLMAIGASVGLQELNGNLISISPNPTNSSLTINSKTELQKIEVVAITGQVLLSELPTNVSHTMNLDNFANGIYFVNLYQNNRIVKREKVVLNR